MNNLPDTSTVQAFAERIRGTVLRPGDQGYEEARTVWNGMVNRRPALIARCRGTADVISAVSFGREHGLLLSIKAGGHNVAGRSVCDGGLAIDLSPMDFIRIDPRARTARVGPGARWRDFDHEAVLRDSAMKAGAHGEVSPRRCGQQRSLCISEV